MTKTTQLKLINLKSIGKIKKDKIINSFVGGSYTSKEAYRIGGIGIGGLRYMNGNKDVDGYKKRKLLPSNIEFFKDGLGFYLRDQEESYLLLIHDEEILNVSFEKKADRIRKKPGFSWFELLHSKGISYHICRMMLLDGEIDELYDAFLKVITKDLDEINFQCHRKNVLKMKSFFEESPYHEIFTSDYATYEYVE